MKRRHSTVVLSVNVGAGLQKVRDVGEALERVWSVVTSLFSFLSMTLYLCFVIALALQNGKSSDYPLLQPNCKVNVGRTCFLAGSIMQGRSS